MSQGFCKDASQRQIVFLLGQKEFTDALQITKEESSGDLENLACRLIHQRSKLPD